MSNLWLCRYKTSAVLAMSMQETDWQSEVRKAIERIPPSMAIAEILVTVAMFVGLPRRNQTSEAVNRSLSTFSLSGEKAVPFTPPAQ
jgi:hypothetical protein